MHYFLKGYLLLLMVLPLTFWQTTFGQQNEIKSISKKLEQELNSKSDPDFTQLFHKGSATKIARDYKTFRNFFINPKWLIISHETAKIQNHYLDIIIKAQRTLNNQNYDLEAKQLLEIWLEEGKIIDYEIVNQESTLKSSNSSLGLEINIPDEVLTGTIYDIEIILNEPLGDYVIGGGLIELKDEILHGNINQSIELEAIQSGGLFKSVQAPLRKGSQTWAALIAHPKGLTAVTKTVNIISRVKNYK